MMHIRTIPKPAGILYSGDRLQSLTQSTAFEARCFETKERLKQLQRANAVQVRAYQERTEERQNKVVPIRPVLTHKERIELRAAQMREKQAQLKRERFQQMQSRRWGSR